MGGGWWVVLRPISVLSFGQGEQNLKVEAITEYYYSASVDIPTNGNSWVLISFEMAKAISIRESDRPPCNIHVKNLLTSAAEWLA